MYLICKNKKIKIEDCISFKDRLIGFMFKKDKITIGKRFPKCNSIHTFFMMQEIDIIMTDKNNKIIKMYKNFKPWKIILPIKNVYYTYELPVNTCKYYNIEDYLKEKRA